jgi:hypothetical protein
VLAKFAIPVRYLFGQIITSPGARKRPSQTRKANCGAS